ncbi:hypothetical protein AURDEDRAFT_178248 [Auricularia subglabra TFB-10046 SS5]|uniref:Uncharacterized protein n=1 Tax=Auricularia subglabra (strain TFB-10046 / SS5) TaxID=717982 RepID=J0WLK2_AURST|nr:hypothetical protein AURDEDRAFT_178248 [Auricularia subglabra TFB-10046 SS5]
MSTQCDTSLRQAQEPDIRALEARLTKGAAVLAIAKNQRRAIREALKEHAAALAVTRTQIKSQLLKLLKIDGQVAHATSHYENLRRDLQGSNADLSRLQHDYEQQCEEDERCRVLLRQKNEDLEEARQRAADMAGYAENDDLLLVQKAIENVRAEIGVAADSPEDNCTVTVDGDSNTPTVEENTLVTEQKGHSGISGGTSQSQT